MPPALLPALICYASSSPHPPRSSLSPNQSPFTDVHMCAFNLTDFADKPDFADDLQYCRDDTMSRRLLNRRVSPSASTPVVLSAIELRHSLFPFAKSVGRGRHQFNVQSPTNKERQNNLYLAKNR